MKYVLFCLLNLVDSNIFSQKTSIICGKVKSADKFIIHFYEPINGFHNVSFLDTSKLNNTLINGVDSIYKIINADQPSFVNIYFTTENKEFITRSDVLISPGDSLHIECDLTSNDSHSIIYTGSNAMGQKLFNEINFQPYNKFIPVFDALDKLPNNKNTFIEEIDSIARSITKRFDSLHEQSLVTDKFVEYMDICVRAFFYNEVIKKFLSDSKRRDVISKGKRDSIMSNFFSKQPATDSRLKGLYLSTFYINNYYNYLAYKKYKLNSIKPLRNGSKTYRVKGYNYFIKEDFTPFIYIEDEEVRRNLWAIEILNYFGHVPGKYDHSVVEQFDTLFPKNIWSVLLQRQFEDKKIITNIEYKLHSPILYVDTSEEISDIISLFSILPKNKPVFIDIWASWCGPCISAFAYNTLLDSFLLNNNIERLYISRDDIDNTKKWKDAIKKYSLGGYHILARESLVSDMRKTIYQIKGNEGMPIPRYLIVNKHGQIIVNDAFSPSEFEKLKEQINRSLELD